MKTRLQKKVLLLTHPRKFQSRLLDWFDRTKRDLPWRRTKDPYRIWVSEIMLQQTRVTAVLEYYKRFLRAFPNLRALARADEQDVLAQWSGLGYYRRARMMHAAAKQLANEGQNLPRTSEGLRDLPGVGQYTAAAIASIAFGEPTAVVDGNVERVLLRLGGYGESESLDFWSSAQQLIDANRPGDFNQAMMELGAIVCLPRVPDCKKCPVENWCATRGEHTTIKPVSRRKARLDYVLAADRNGVALVQRAAHSRLMAGMWELPETSAKKSPSPAMQLKHSITNTDYEVRVWKGARPTGSTRIQLSRIEELPLTGLTLKILRRMGLLLHPKS
ncbi:MAG: putative A/G-specific adenine glycosylase [Acidobacteriaceae bacterium]|nr:putative A/G-specific adenine glycosylase [Acidobacteriaceae bacterium]